MQTLWNNALWRQFGAAIDMLDNAIANCPDALWRQRLWSVSADRDTPPEFAEFWFLSYHAIFWLDLYLAGRPEAEFVPPAPFSWAEDETGWSLPAQPYTKEELRAYLAATRQKCHTTLLGLTDERARQTVEYAWSLGPSVSYLELQLYSMRHVQEHAAQLSLLLGQNGVPDEALDSVALARDNYAGQ